MFFLLCRNKHEGGKNVWKRTAFDVTPDTFYCNVKPTISRGWRIIYETRPFFDKNEQLSYSSFNVNAAEKRC